MTYLVFVVFTLMVSVFTVGRAYAVCDVSIGGTPYGSIQAAVNAAGAGDTINVTVGSVCIENVIIRNEKTRFTMDGNPGFVGPGATISPASGNVINVRGKGIVIKNFNITGGSNGIWINRGSNASIADNNISNLSSRGIILSNLAYAIIINNTIQNNGNDGIRVAEGSNARIGFAETSDLAASPNTISNNGNRGINVSLNSSAWIVGNTISNNTDDGILVSRNSQANTASNTINGNGDNGINVTQNSALQLGEDNPVDFMDQPNITTANNTNFGIRCVAGGVVRGHLGSVNQLTGAVNQFGGNGTNDDFNGSCPGGSAALDIP